MHGPELFCQLLERLGQAVIGRHGAGPDGVAAVAWQCDGAQHADLGKGGLEGHVGVPRIGTATMLRIEFEKRRAIGRRHRGMGLQRAEQLAEGLVRLVVQMRLAAKEQHAVLEQRGLDLIEQRSGQIARELDAAHDGADATGQWLDRKLRCFLACCDGLRKLCGGGDDCVHASLSSVALLLDE